MPREIHDDDGESESFDDADADDDAIDVPRTLFLSALIALPFSSVDFDLLSSAESPPAVLPPPSLSTPTPVIFLSFNCSMVKSK